MKTPATKMFLLPHLARARHGRRLPSPAWLLATVLATAPIAAQGVATAGDLYVTEEANGQVHRHNGVNGASLGLFSTVPPLCGLMAIHTSVGPGHVLVGSNVGGVRELNRDTGALIRTYNPSGGWQWAGVYAPNGDVLIGDMSSNDVRRYSSLDGGLIGVFGSVPGPADMLFGPNGNLFVCSFTNGGVYELNGTTGALVAQRVPSIGMTNDIAFMADGRRVVTSMATNLAYVFDAGWSQLATLAGTGWGRPHGVDISPHDGNIYVIDGVTQSVHVFHATSYAELTATFLTIDSKPVDIEFRRGRLAAVTHYGSGCHGLTIGHVGLPAIGRQFDLTLSGARPGQPAFLLLGGSDSSWAGLPLPLRLDVIGAPGCVLLAAGDVLLPTVTDASGGARLPLAVPADPDLIGATVFAQWVVFDPSANGLGLVMSDGAANRIGE